MVKDLTALLEQANTVHQRAKDILRTSRLRLLAADDAEVAKDINRINQGNELSPILLVRGDLGQGTLRPPDVQHR